MLGNKLDSVSNSFCMNRCHPLAPTLEGARVTLGRPVMSADRGGGDIYGAQDDKLEGADNSSDFTLLVQTQMAVSTS